MPNTPIAGHIDDGECILLEQEGRYINIKRGSVPELCRLLKIVHVGGEVMPRDPRELFPPLSVCKRTQCSFSTLELVNR
jgi:hypothetical protein